MKPHRMLLRSHGGGNCSGDGGAHEGGPDLHPTAQNSPNTLVYEYEGQSKITEELVNIFLLGRNLTHIWNEHLGFITFRS